MRDGDELGGDVADWPVRCAHWIVETDRAAPARRRRERRAEPLILAGHGLSIRVEKGALSIRDGLTHYPQQKREHRLFKGSLDAPTRIVIVDGSGEITLDALDWMAAQGVALIRLSWDGEARAVLSPAGYAADPKRVAWQRATRTDPATRLPFAFRLITAKLDASLETLRRGVPPSRFRETAIALAEQTLARLTDDPPASAEALLGIEGKAAKAYFTAWRGVPLRWRGERRNPVPDGWRTYDTRTSLATGPRARNRHASHPMNAMLNYAYGVLEARLTVQAVSDGYDPTVGIMHVSTKHERDRVPAFALDLMEPERPRVDAAVLAFVRETFFSGADFTLRDDGVCRLNPELARRVVQLVDAVVETPPALLSPVARAGSGKRSRRAHRKRA